MTRPADLDEQAVVDGYLAGKSLRDLAAEFGTSTRPIERVLKLRQIERRPARRPRGLKESTGRTRGRGWRSFDEAERSDVIARFLAGETQAAIGERYGCHVGTISRVLREGGVAPGAHGQLRTHHHNWKGGRRVDENGYVMVRPEADDEIGQIMKAASKYVFEHRLVMAHALGRPLTSEETVHHGPGGRADNRIENLELWASRHPRGQRVEDLVSFAREILELYGNLPPSTG